jgi:hypothetical protein
MMAKVTGDTKRLSEKICKNFDISVNRYRDESDLVDSFFDTPDRQLAKRSASLVATTRDDYPDSINYPFPFVIRYTEAPIGGIESEKTQWLETRLDPAPMLSILGYQLVISNVKRHETVFCNSKVRIVTYWTRSRTRQWGLT